ncbi:hypothetical protein NDI76_11895 [Halogeometricum sp. S1BR25-6]|uniref:DUF7115 domain-containing protein n=1 Tax=Halogeometricum salsisoli TaxID=2950536 RepID=A0ABU2GF93_9EURY|nr:hypothetical protein [Halogeometricum sp. S1BR25-6]MDS0299444.1 hypothetical protein [Halogeometricum sp. S1BR25-6]
MSQPQMVQSALDGEPVVARVALGGEDELYVTPTRTLVYRSEGLLSDETVEEYPHEAERVALSEGRRKTKVALDYGLDGERTVALSNKHLARALQPMLEGVLKANGILADDEAVERLFRFSELTLVVAGGRVVKHIGASLWDEDFEEYRFDDVTDLQFEGGSVATSVVLTVDGRQERFKAPNEDARQLRETLESALLAHRGVDSLDELRAAAEPEAETTATDGESADAKNVSFGDGPEPLSANPAELTDAPANATRTGPSESAESVEAAAELSADASGVARPVEAPIRAASAPAAGSGDASETAAASVGEGVGVDTEPELEPDRESDADRDEAAGAGEDGFEGSGFQSAAADANERVAQELAELRATVERQGEEIREQRALVEQLIEELRRGR